MATRKVLRRKLTKYQGGDLRERIEIGDNVLKPAGFGKAGMIHKYVKEADTWARMETAVSVGSGEVLFNGVNISTKASHIFVMRYRDNFTADKWIRWRNEAYEVDLVLDPEERHEYIAAFVYLEGSQGKKANT